MNIYTEEIWFSPINVLYHFSRLESVLSPSKRKSQSFRKAEEAFFTAIMLMGIIKHTSTQYWLQIVQDSEGTPDIRTATFKLENEKPVELLIQEIEVVEFGRYSNEDVADFIIKKKLSKNYPDYITILCRVSKEIVLPTLKKINSRLKAEKSKNPVIILAKLSDKEPNYRICQVHPHIGLLQDFTPTILDENFIREYKGVIRIQSGNADKLDWLYLPEEKHYPFENLGL